MKIKDILKNRDTTISFEVFPPKKGSGTLSNMEQLIASYSKLNPDYISVTFGAGGSTSKNSLDIASLIRNKYDISALAHITCLSSRKEDIILTLDQLKKNNVDNILSLRGDFPRDNLDSIPNPLHFEYASDLTKFIKSQYGDRFCIGGACYPEGHLESRSLTQDILHLKNKVDSGTDFLISQMFFDNDVFYSFMNRCQKAGIKIPLIPGIMPVTNGNLIKNILSMSGASMPKKFIRILDKYENDPEALAEAGTLYAIDQILDLMTMGVKGIHIYAMNKPQIPKQILSAMPNILKIHHK